MTDVYTARYYYSCYIKRLFKIAYSEARYMLLYIKIILL